MKILNEALKITYFAFIAILLVACGGGGGGDVIAQQSTSQSFFSGVTVGDFGTVDVDKVNKIFSFKFVDSAYGKTGTRTATLEADTNGTYIGTTSSGYKFPIVVTKCYVMAALQMDENVTSDLTPLFGVDKSCAISSATKLISYGSTHSIAQYQCDITNQTATACKAIAGKATFSLVTGTDTQITAKICDNAGIHDDAHNINLINCTTSTNVTLTYNASNGYWEDTSGIKILRGVFAYDPISQNVVGFFDKVSALSASFTFSTSFNSKTPTAAELGDHYKNTIQKQAIVSGGPGRPSTQIHTIPSVNNYNSCPTTGTESVINGFTLFAIRDFIDSTQTTPSNGQILGAEVGNTNYRMLSTILNMDTTSNNLLGIGVATASDITNVNINNFKFIYVSKNKGYCYSTY